MDRSTLRLPDPSPGSPNGERRHRVRQKLHTPVYASFNGPDSGIVVDLSELLDLHESGFAVQTSAGLETNRAVTICLDLPETRSFIHGTGEVIWSDDAGRSGIRFSTLPDDSRQRLREWLFANLLIACSNYSARTQQIEVHRREVRQREAPPQRVEVEVEQNEQEQQDRQQQDRPQAENHLRAHPATPAHNVVLMPDRIASLSPIEVVVREVRELGDNIDAILQFISESAWELTGARGAALALLTDDKMIWRSATGDPVPPLSSQVDVSHGLSGECVRTGVLVSCDDMENDPRIDPEIGRALGIGSLMAAPIVSDFRVVGLLEIFSPHPQAFTKTHGTILDRLVELVPKTPHGTIRAGQAEAVSLQKQSSTENQADSESAPAPRPEFEESPVSTSRVKSQIKPGIMTVSQAIAIMSRPQVSQSPPVHPSVEEAVESNSFAAIRANSRESVRDVQEIAPKTNSTEAPKEIPDPVPQLHTAQVAEDRIAKSAIQTLPSLRSRVLHLGLLGTAIVVVATVVGYLVGPMVEKRWPAASHAAQSSLVKGAEASEPASFKRTSDGISSDHASFDHASSDHGAADRGTIEQHAPQRSLADLQTLANRGDADAQWQLGLRYHNGEGVLRNDTQAMLWFQLAAEQGHVTAEAALGAYYWAGRGVPQDLSKSYFWSEIALAQGDENSKSRIEGLSSQMTQAQVSAARQKAEVWIQAHNLRANSPTN